MTCQRMPFHSTYQLKFSDWLQDYLADHVDWGDVA